MEHPEALLLAGWKKIGEVQESKELSLATMNKAELLKFAEENGIEINNPSRTNVNTIRELITTALEAQKEDDPETQKIDLDTASDEELQTLAQELGVETEEGETRESLIEKLQKAAEDANQE